VQKSQVVSQAGAKGLKEHFNNQFSIGVAVNMSMLKTADTSLILREFNSITAENDMKIGPIHPEENRYNWKAADSIVAFARRHGLRVRGHNLVWHYPAQTPQWLFKDTNGNPASKELVLQRLKDHITTVVSRYKGAVYAWDVANEVISDTPDEYLRSSEWYKICGEDYIIKAFQYAHEADPQALLFYNDYDEINPAKREKIYRLVKRFKRGWCSG
jgi:endo-1,4-beta-xylanase